MGQVSNNFEGVLNILQKYFQNDGYLLDWDTVDRFEQLPCYIEEDEYICVHAGVPLDSEGKLVPLRNVSIEQLVYDWNSRSRPFYRKGINACFSGIHLQVMFQVKTAYFVIQEKRIQAKLVIIIK